MNSCQWVVDVILLQTSSHLQRFDAGTFEISVIVSRRFAKVYAGKQDKNVGLNKSHTNVQSLKNNRYAQGNQREKDERDHLSRKHVCEE